MSVGALLTALAAVIIFALMLVRSGVLRIAGDVTQTASRGVTSMLDADLDDRAKEKAVQQAGLRLLGLSWQLAWRIALALFTILIPIPLSDFLGLATLEESYGVLLRFDFLIIVSIAAFGLNWLWRKCSGTGEMDRSEQIADSNAYGTSDQMIHAIAFSSTGLSKSLSKLDDIAYRKAIARVEDEPPIFITSLARGGTTALLNALHDLPGVATHRYCDMPFLTAPLLWNRLRGRRATGVSRERAHGDGIQINLQSPEAFDEVFWMMHWPEKYRSNRIDLWDAADAQEPARAFFLQHFRKIILQRNPQLLTERDGTAVPRYLSKNNANIARLALLPKLFPGCKIVVPLREPSAHAASLFRQHKNFLTLHAKDKFAKRYMRDIGHFEFGALHRPMAFDMELLAGRSPDQPDYWLAYWTACFESVAQHSEQLLLITQDSLRADPIRSMENLLDGLNLSPPDQADWRKAFISKPDAKVDDLFDGDLLDRARATYSDLQSQCYL